MAVYSIADRSASITAAARLAEFRTGATYRAKIQEIGVTVGVAGAAPTIGIIRPNAIGVTPTSPKTALPHDSGDGPATCTTATAWATPPTLAGSPVYLRRIGLPASVGAGWVWTFYDDELVVPVSSSILIDLVAISAAVATAVDFYIRYRE